MQQFLKMALFLLLFFITQLNAYSTDDFVTKWHTTTDGEYISIPTEGTGYNYSIDWGDGTSESGLTGDATHYYPTAGTYTVSISGDFPRIYFFKLTSAYQEKIISIEQWGTGSWSSMRGAFKGCSNLIGNATDTPNLSNVEDLRYMFYEASAFNQNIEDWNISNVTDLGGMFYKASTFNQPLNNWDISNVTNIGAMFYKASTFNQPLNNWDVSNVTDMHGLFAQASSFNQPLNDWNVSNVTTMSDMFYFASSFNQPLNNWDVSSVTSISYMFHEAISFNQPLDNWNISNVMYMMGMFTNTPLSIRNYDNLLINWNNLILPNDIDFTANIAKYCRGEVARSNINSTYNWSFNDAGKATSTECDDAYGDFITIWETTTDSESITIPTTGGGYNYTIDWGDGTTQSALTGNATHTYDTAGTHTISISGTFPQIYFNNTGDKDKIISIEQWGTGSWSSMEKAFWGCSNLAVNATDTPDLTNVSLMNQMFQSATAFNQDIDDWNVSNVTNMNNMFNGATSFNQDIGNWDVGNVASMNGMFNKATTFNQDIGKWNVSNVTDMRFMFFGASAFNQDIGEWNVSNMTNMHHIFTSATAFNQDISNWDVSNVTNMQSIFYNTKAFNQDISNWDVSNVTDMSYMFYYATAFNQDIGDWNVSNVTTMYRMFSYASAFNQDIGGWDVSNVTTMYQMFNSAKAFNQPLRDWNVSNVTNMYSMFYSADKFDQPLGDWNVSNVTNMEYMFFAPLSIRNYDDILIGWSKQSLQTGVTLLAYQRHYCKGETARQNMIDNQSWTISDSGKATEAECIEAYKPMLEYRFDTCAYTGAVGEVVDSAEDNNATILNGAHTSRGILNSSVDFNGTNYIKVDNTPTLEVGKDNHDFSVSFWLKLDAGHTGSWRSITHKGNTDTDRTFAMWMSPNNNTLLYVISIVGQSNFYKYSTNELSIGTWIHISYIKSGDTLQLYIDGALDSQVIITNDIVSNNGPLYIGKDPWYDGIDGQIDEFKIFDYALSTDDVQDIYANEPNGRAYNAIPRYSLVCDTPTCQTPPNGLTQSTFDISAYASFPDSNLEYESLITDYMNDTNYFGEGIASTINGSGNPYGSPDNYLTLFNGYIKVDNDGLYQFAVDGDDAVEVIIDDNIVASWYGGHAKCSCTTHNGAIYLKSGYHSVEFRHQDGTGGDNYYLYWQKPEDSSFTIIPNENLFYCRGVTADYHFDSCVWDGSADEVKDYSGNDYHGTTHGATQPSNGFLQNGVYFDYDDTTHYISLNHNALNNVKDFTINMWYKSSTTETSKKRIFLSAANTSTSNEALMWFANSTSFYSYIKGEYKTTTTPDIADNLWHMLTWTRKIDTSCIFIDGNLSGCVEGLPTGNLTVNENGLIIGQEQDRVGGNFVLTEQPFGYQDELKIFDYALWPKQISELYTNESNTLNRTNYDGSHRMAEDCTTPELLAEYHFDSCKYTGATGEVIDSEGEDNNGTITGDVNINKDTKKIGHALQLNGGAVNIDNLAVSTQQYKKNTVMFWMYWDGTSQTMPFGWHYYDLIFYNNIFGFNSANGDLYGISWDGLANGWHHVCAIFTNKDIHSNRLYIDGELQPLSQLKGTPDNTNTITTAYASIGGWRRDNNYNFKGYLDELKIYKGELDASTIVTIYNHENTLTRDIICSQAIFNAVNRVNGCFNWDNNITTKVAGNPIDLTILSADENDDNNSLLDTNITKIELLSFADASCSMLYDTTELWSGNEEVNTSGCFTPSSFTHNKVIKCAKIRITGIFEGNSVESNASDTFSLRPDKFILQNLPTGKLTAEESYTFQAKAVNSDGSTASVDFNQSVTPQSTKYFRDDTDGSTMEGTFAPTAAFAFSDGVTADTTLSFDNVGKIGLELNDTTWTEVDSDDTPLKDRTIYMEQNLTFIPDRFEITFDATPTMDNHGRSFTYYANDLANMSADLKNLSFKVTALGKNSTTMTNYHDNAQYYANHVDFSLGLALEKSPIQSNDINETNSDKNINFDKGIATLSYADIYFNFGRERNVTKEPLALNGTNSNLAITITDRVDTTVTGTKNQALDGDATFYYGKVRTEDIKTAQNSTPSKTLVQIYSTSSLTGFEQLTSSWYLNKEDDFSAISSLVAKEKRALSSSTSTYTATTNLTASNAGKITYDVTNSHDSSYRAFYHLAIDPWLWYSRYSDYDATSTSDCSAHPCFEYLYESKNDGTGIKSGTFNGSGFANDFNSSIERKAIKLMR